MKTLASLFLGLFLLLPLTGCGTIFFQQRSGKEHSGNVDPNIMILDGIGLIFWILPGVVAYIVDFSTGAAYLPKGVEKGEGPFFKDETAKKD